MLSCKVCNFSTEDPQHLLNHTIRYHQNAPGFQIKCGKCGKCFKNMRTLRRHFKDHPSLPQRLATGQEMLASTSSHSDDMDLQQDIQVELLAGDENEDEADDDDAEENLSDDDEGNFPYLEDLVDSDDEEYADIVHMMNSHTELPIHEEAASEAPKSSQQLIQEGALELLMHIKENCHTTQTAVDEIVKGVDNLFALYNRFLKECIVATIPADCVSKVGEVFDGLQGQSVFEGVQTAYKQRKVVSQDWKSIVKPLKLVLKTEISVVNDKVVEVPKDFGYVVPFIKQLESLLQNDSVMDCIENARTPSEDGTFRSVLDGYWYREHPLVLKDPQTLAFILYCDDIQPADPLGSKQEQRLRTYYWVLANIHPELRSSLRAINILSIVKADMGKKYNNRPFLLDFVNSINKLSSDAGVTLNVQGEKRNFHGILLFCVGDTPASANLGGFKESPGFAEKPCRHCMVSKDDLYEYFEEAKYLRRTLDMHKQHVKAVLAFKGDLSPVSESDNEAESDEDELESNEDEDDDVNPSVNFGVNHKSILMDIDSYDVTQCLPEDVMHVLGEGILPLVVRLVLGHAIDKGLPLSSINDFLSNLDYGMLRRDKPSPITAKHMQKGIRQSSAQMFLLFYLLPFIVMNHCEDSKKKLIAKLLMIVNICLSFQVSTQDARQLAKVIMAFLSDFKSQYPGSLIPKMHFLIHLPTQILLFGPLIQQWAMRFEAFHAPMKRLTRILHNMKNLSYSLITRMLFKRALEMKMAGEKFLYEGHHFKLSGKAMNTPSKHQAAICEAFPSLSSSSPDTVKKLNYFGSSFQTGSIVLISIQDDNSPVIGSVAQIYKYNSDLVLVLRRIDIISFHCTLNAFEVVNTRAETYEAVKIQDIYHPCPLFLLRHNETSYVLWMHNSSHQFNHSHCSGC